MISRKYSEDMRTSTMPRWYEKSPAIDLSLLKGTYLGIVRDSRDPQKMGRIMVWVPEISGEADEPKNWLICHYCSPFAGASFLRNDFYHDKKGHDIIEELYDGSGSTANHRTPDKQKGKYSGRQSYGMWFTQPDVGNEVLITFVNGDPNFGVWFGSLFPQDTNHMVPGIAEGQIFNGSSSSLSDERGPVMEPDYTLETATGNNDSPRKLKYSSLYSGLKYKQGTHGDYVRGQSTSSARRESPSEVFGILTPDGNQFVMDDKQDQEFIRLRTKSGAQLLINQTSGMIYAISRDGTTWIELSNEGNVDIYGAENISVHAEKANVNVKAGQDINMQAGRNINLKTGGDFSIEVGGNFNLGAGGTTIINSDSKTSIKGNIVGITAVGTIGITSDADLWLQGASLFLNSGPGVTADTVVPIATYTPSGPTTSSGDEEPWVAGAPYASGSNTVPRVPQHEPWNEHAISTTGTNNNVAEGPLDPKIPLGATSSTATKPNDITYPDGRRLEGDGYNSADQPEYFQVANAPACAITPINQLQISQNGLDTIKHHEGVRNRTYKDQAGLDTIGVGHLITASDVSSGRFASGEISDAEVNSLLLEDLANVQKAVRGCITQPLTQNQYDACISLAFNIGNSGFCNSTAAKKINAGDYQPVPNNFMRWNKVTIGGVLTVSSGLTNRRRDEANLFASEAPPCEETTV